MKKTLLRIGIALFLLLVVALAGAYVYADRIAKAAIETGGTRALGTDTSLENVHLRLFRGDVSLDELVVANPPGFDASDVDVPYFLRLGRGELEVSLPTLLEDRIVAPRLVLEDLVVSLQKEGGTSNYEIILDNLERFESKDTQPEPTNEKEGGKTFVIELVSIRDITVHADLVQPGLPVGERLTRMPPVRIEEIRLTDVGSESGGVVLAQLMDVIVKAVLRTVALKVKGLPGDMLAELGSGLGDLTSLTGVGVEMLGGVTQQAADAMGEGADAIRENLERFGDKLGAPGKAVEGVGEGAGAVVEGAGKAVGGVGKGVEKVGEGLDAVGEGTGKVFDKIGGLIGGTKKKKAEKEKPQDEDAGEGDSKKKKKKEEEEEEEEEKKKKKKKKKKNGEGGGP